MNARIPPVSALRAFEAAARLSSLTRAAESLSLTHGAISHQIKALEEELGVRLIERAGRGIRLTDEGERLATRVRTALGDLADALREVRERSNPHRLRVSVMPSFAARWVLPRVGTFLSRHPQIDLDVRASTALVDFQRDDIDAAIRYGSGSYPGLATTHLMDDSFFIVCSPRLPGGVPRRPAELSRCRLLRAANDPWKPWFAAAGLDWPEPSRGPIFEDTSHAIQAAIEGQGVALARTSLIGNDLANGLLVQPFDVTVSSANRYYLVHPPRLATAPKLVAFREWLFEQIAAGAASARRKRVR